jgi:hypothetical protein
MSDTPSAEDPPLTDYPGHSGSFGNLMHLSGLSAGDAQTLVRDKESSLGLLNKVRDDELPLLFNIGTNHYTLPDLDVSRRTVAVEATRRSLASAKTSIAAIGRLRDSVEALATVTEGSSAVTVAALGHLQHSLDDLRASTNTWSRWLTRLTIAVMGLTALLVVLALAQRGT